MRRGPDLDDPATAVILIVLLFIGLVVGAWYILTPSKETLQIQYRVCMTSGPLSEWVCRTNLDYWEVEE